MQLTEKYRPKTFDEIIGHGPLVRKVRALMNRAGFDRGAFWIVGATGVGKTTLARVMAASVGCDRWAIDEIDGDQCGAEAVREISMKIGLGAWGQGAWRAYIINEAHAMTSRAVQAWLTLLERLPAKRLVMFTTTEYAGLFGGFTQPFQDRTVYLELKRDGLREKFARRAMEIADRERLNGRGLDSYLRLLDESNCSMRAALMRIERGDMLDPEPEPTPAEAHDGLAADVGKRLSTHRLRASMGLADAARAVGVMASELQAYEDGKAVPDVPVLLKLAKVLGVTSWAFLGNVDAPGAGKDGLDNG